IGTDAHIDVDLARRASGAQRVEGVLGAAPTGGRLRRAGRRDLVELRDQGGSLGGGLGGAELLANAGVLALGELEFDEAKLFVERAADDRMTSPAREVLLARAVPLGRAVSPAAIVGSGGVGTHAAFVDQVLRDAGGLRLAPALFTEKSVGLAKARAGDRRAAIGDDPAAARVGGGGDVSAEAAALHPPGVGEGVLVLVKPVGDRLADPELGVAGGVEHSAAAAQNAA